MSTPTASTTSTAPPTFWGGVWRQFDYWLVVVARTWRGTLFSSFLSPLLYVLAMGVVLGGFIDGDPDQLEGATSYLAFIVPGLVAAHAMQTAVSESTYPVMSMIKWQRVYDSMLATPLTVPQVVVGHLAFIGVRLAATCGVFMLVLAPFGVFATWWGPLVAYLSQILVGMTFASLVYGLTCRITRESAFGVIFRLGVFPLFLFSGAFFPVSNLGPIGATLARITPLWHGVSLSRMFSIDAIDVSTAVINVVVLLVLLCVGVVWSITGLRNRMAD